MKVVVSAAPFHLTTAPLTKLLPLTVSVKADPPTAAFVGEREVIVGTGLTTGKVEVPEVPPPGAGLVTVTLSDPVLVMSEAGTAAVIWLALTKVAVSDVPFHLTTDPLTKPLPLTVNVKAVPPTIALVGENETMVGPGLLIGKVHAPEVPPPGAGLVTVTLAEPAPVVSLAGTAAVI